MTARWEQLQTGFVRDAGVAVPVAGAKAPAKAKAGPRAGR
jgi:hypothetical protein